MELLNFLRKKKVIEFEKIKFQDIFNWIQDKENEIKGKSRESSKMIKERILILSDDLEKKIPVLEEMDWKKIKSEERIKLIVKGNLNTYLTHLKKLVNDLKELDDESNIMENVTSLFAAFEKKSSINLEKATFLVGKELHAVKISIGNFFKYIKKNVDEDVIKTSRVLSSIKLKVQEIDENNKARQEINSTIRKLEARTKELEIQYKDTEDKIKRIVSSEEHREKQKRDEERKKEKERLRKAISRMKELIDFKALANAFHSSEKNMGIIKSHRENFKDSFQKDNGESILHLLDEANLNSQAIKDKLEEISNITIDDEIIVKDELKELEATLKGIKMNLENLSKEKVKELKREEKLNAPERELLNLVKKELAEINVILN